MLAPGKTYPDQPSEATTLMNVGFDSIVHVVRGLVGGKLRQGVISRKLAV